MAKSTMTAPALAELPPAVRASYKELLKNNEEWLYRRALKSADAVLKVVPDHADTLAQKAFALLKLQRRDEAYTLVQRAIRESKMKSIFALHVLGMVHLRDGNHMESIKAFRLALRIDANNQQVLSELSRAQLSLRDFASYHETRRALLVVRPVFENWLQLALSEGLAGNKELALGVLQQYEQLLGAKRAPSYQFNEALMVRSMLHEQTGDLTEALAVLEAPANTKWLLDQHRATEKRAQLKLQLGRYADALREVLKLIAINQEHYGYHRGLQACLLESAAWIGLTVTPPAAAPATAGPRGAPTPVPAPLINFSWSGSKLPTNTPEAVAALAPVQVDTLLAVYLQLAVKYPSSRAIKRIPLDLLPHDDATFVPLLAAYLRASFRKGIPALYADLKTLSRQPGERGLGWHARITARRGVDGTIALTDKARILRRLADEAIVALLAGTPLPAPPLDVAALVARLAAGARTLPELPSLDAAALARMVRVRGDPGDSAATAAAAVATGPSIDDISALPWVRLFAARLADECGDTDAALRYLDDAVAHTPTVLDLFTARARVLKHRGDVLGGTHALDYARSLDLADRYLNTKTVKYLLRVGDPEAANRAIAMFVKADAKDSPDPLSVLKTLEAAWYELESGAAHERLGNISLALQHYHRLEWAYLQLAEQQHDYPYWSAKHGALRPFLDLLVFVDQMPGHHNYAWAVAGMVRCYLLLAGDASARVGHMRWYAAPAAGASAGAIVPFAGGGGGKMPSAKEAAAAASAASFASLIPSAAVAALQAVATEDDAAAEAVYARRLALRSVQPAMEATAAVKAVAEGANAFRKARPPSDDEKWSKSEYEQAVDPSGMGDVQAQVADPLAEAAKWVGVLVSNLPSQYRHIVPDATAAVGNPLKHTTPSAGLSTRPITSDPRSADRGWNWTPDFVATVFALAAETAARQGRLLLAMSYLRSAQRAAAAAPRVALTRDRAAAAAAAAVPVHHFHAATLGAALRVYSAVEAARAAAGGAGAEAPFGQAEVIALLSDASQMGGASSVAAWVDTVAVAVAATSVELQAVVLQWAIGSAVCDGPASTAFSLSSVVDASGLPALSAAQQATAATVAALRPRVLTRSDAARDVLAAGAAACVRGAISAAALGALRAHVASLLPAGDRDIAAAVPVHEKFELRTPLAPPTAGVDPATAAAIARAKEHPTSADAVSEGFAGSGAGSIAAPPPSA